MRSFLKTEQNDEREPTIEFLPSNTLKCNQKKFMFDRVFHPFHSQGVHVSKKIYILADSIFQEVKALVVSVLDGYSVCVFAFGN